MHALIKIFSISLLPIKDAKNASGWTDPFLRLVYIIQRVICIDYRGKDNKTNQKIFLECCTDLLGQNLQILLHDSTAIFWHLM